MAATTSSTSSSLKKMAYDLLMAHDVKDLFPGFTLDSVVEADRRKVKLLAQPGQLKVDRMDGKRRGVSRFTYATLGHLVSKVAFKMQESWDEENEDKIVIQDNLAFKHLNDPSRDAQVVIFATFATAQSKIDHLLFTIESEPSKKTMFATGSSNIAVYRRSTTSKPPSSSTRGSSGEKSGAEASRKSAAEPQPPNAPSTSSAPAPLAVTIWRKPPTPTAEVLPSVVTKQDRVATSILRRPPTDDFSPPKRIRRVTFAEDEEKTEEYMIVNVRTPCPEKDKTLEKLLNAIGVEGENVRHELLPVTKMRSYVFFFTVSSSLGCSRVEKLVEERRWHERFNVQSFVADRPVQFVAKALPVETIIEAMLLSQRRSHQLKMDSQLAPADDLMEQLADKKNLGYVVKDAEMTKEVLQGLNKRGACIFKRKLKPMAIM